MQFPFVGGAYLSRSLKLDAQRCVNLYPALGESGTAKSVAALFGTPGLRRLAQLDGGGIRALYPTSDGTDAIVVAGYNVYRVNTAFEETLVGTIDDETTPVSIADDGVLAVLVSGQRGYTLNLLSNTLERITDVAFYGAKKVSYTDTYFLFERPGYNHFYLAEQVDGALTFDALDFGVAESDAEPIVTHALSHGEVLLFKSTGTEVWRDVGNGADFPYARSGNALIEQGCVAPYSVVSKLDNSVFWLGGDDKGTGIVYRMNGYRPDRISHDGVEQAIQSYADISDATAYGYQQDGHTFYVLNFPSGRTTWVYDVGVRLWHERRWRDPETAQFERHRGACHMFYGGEHVVGDWEDGRLYTLDLECYDDDGDPLVALRSAPHLADPDYRRMRVHALEVDIEPGVGLNDGQGSDPQLMMRFSRDGGRTWSTERTASMGMIGDFTARARWTRLGNGRDMVFEVSVSDPVKRVFVGAAVKVEGLSR